MCILCFCKVSIHKECTIFRAGFVSIVGRPSVGKSTFINLVCGHNTSITSPYPQTTRNIIRAIVTKENFQIVFLDTPGLHKSEKNFGKFLTKNALHALHSSDVILYMLDAQRRPGEEERFIIDILKNIKKPLCVCINKMDIEKEKIVHAHLDFLREYLKDKIQNCHFISSAHNINVDVLIDNLGELLPEHEAYYSRELYTDQSPDFRICEQVRLATIEHMREELPYAIHTELLESSVKHRDALNNVSHLFVRVLIAVERENQKAIVIGKKGMTIKHIKKQAQEALKEIFDYKIQLEIKVDVRKKWKSQVLLQH